VDENGIFPYGKSLKCGIVLIGGILCSLGRPARPKRVGELVDREYPFASVLLALVSRHDSQQTEIIFFQCSIPAVLLELTFTTVPT
jgi:hypothetical protein